MARKRSRRRRQSILWTSAVVASLLVLIFARDVSRTAHGDVRAVRSENQSFAVLSNAIITEENTVDSTLTALLVRGAQFNRAQLSAQMTTLNDTLRVLPAQASQLRNPTLRNDVNGKLATWCQARASAYSSLLSDVAATLSLPWPTRPAESERQAVTVLRTTTGQWHALTTVLAHQPGHVVLTPFSDFTGVLDIGALTQQMLQTPSLKVARSLAIAAVSVSPAPFPAPPGDLELVGTSPLVLGVSVLNGSFANQPASVTATLVSSTGVTTTRRMSATLGPRRAYAFSDLTFALVSGERATLRIVVTGAPATPGQSTVRTYRVHVASTFVPPAG